MLRLLTADWDALNRELDQWRKTRAIFWWRDDDATSITVALDRLLELRLELRIPLGLSVIPATLDPQLPNLLALHADIAVLQHGWDHADHGNSRKYKAELSERRDATEVQSQLEQGKKVLTEQFGAQALPVLTPPYDYLARHLVGVVRRVGFKHVSMHGDFNRRSISSRNVHADLIDWREERAVALPIAIRSVIAALKMRRFGLIKRTAPIGIKTHHLQHDEDVWALTKALLVRLTAHQSASFPPVGEIFA